MKTLKEFLDTIEIRKDVLVNQPDADLTAWYKRTMSYFIGFFGERHFETAKIRMAAQAYDKERAGKSPFDMIAINNKHRDKAIDLIMGIIVEFEKEGEEGEVVGHVEPDVWLEATGQQVEDNAPDDNEITMTFNGPIPGSPESKGTIRTWKQSPPPVVPEKEKKDSFWTNPNPWVLVIGGAIVTAFITKLIDGKFNTNIWSSVTGFLAQDFTIPVGMLIPFVALLVATGYTIAIGLQNRKRKKTNNPLHTAKRIHQRRSD